MNNSLINKFLLNDDLYKNRLITFEEEQEIFKLLEKDPNLREDIQTIMIKSNMRLIYSIAKDYYPVASISNDDIIQLGMIGIAKAVDKFDYHKQIRFSSYATYWIKQSISRGLYKALREMEQSMNVTELRKKFYETERQLISSLKRRVTFNEVANKMGIKSSELMVIFHFTNTDSLDKNATGEHPILEKLKDNDLTPQEFVLNEEKNKLIAMAIDSLSMNEQKIIRYRYGYEDGIYHSFSEIAKKFGFSRQRAQAIEKNALIKMREFLEEIE